MENKYHIKINMKSSSDDVSFIFYSKNIEKVIKLHKEDIINEAKPKILIRKNKRSSLGIYESKILPKFSSCEIMQK